MLLCFLAQTRQNVFSLGWKRDKTEMFLISGKFATILAGKVDLEYHSPFFRVGYRTEMHRQAQHCGVKFDGIELSTRHYPPLTFIFNL